MATARRALDIIGKYESDPVGGYNAVNQIGVAGGRGVLGYSGDITKMKQHGGRPLTDMTVGEIMELQRDGGGLSNDQWINQGKLHAVGRYQFIGPTLADRVNKLKIDPNEKFTPELQDKLALNYIKEAGSISPWVGPSDKATAEERAEINAFLKNPNQPLEFTGNAQSVAKAPEKTTSSGQRLAGQKNGTRSFMDYLKSDDGLAGSAWGQSVGLTPQAAGRKAGGGLFATAMDQVNKQFGGGSSSSSSAPAKKTQVSQTTPQAAGSGGASGPDGMELAYIAGNIGPTSTGQHLDVKRTDGGYFDYGDLDDFVMVQDKDLGLVPLGGVPETGDWESHTRRGSHGRDYGTYEGSKIYLRNGAKVLSRADTEHGNKTVIGLPNGQSYSFLHGMAPG